MKKDTLIKYYEDELGLNIESIGKKHFNDLILRFTSEYTFSDIDELKRYFGKELGELTGEILVPETWFFRDSDAFAFLAEYLKSHSNGAGALLRILSAPCSSGEEPYSIAICLNKIGLDASRYEIDAFDINPVLIEKAMKGDYSRNSFRGSRNDYSIYFDLKGTTYSLKKEFGFPVKFYVENIVSRSFPDGKGMYDIIFCKNMLIYLNNAARKIISENIVRLLKPEGLLFTGYTELGFFLQNGYIPVEHRKSFACIKSGENGKSHKATALNLKKEILPSGKKITVNRKIHEKITRPPELPEKNTRDLIKPDSLEIIKDYAGKGLIDDARKLCADYLISNPAAVEAYCLMGTLENNAGNTEAAADCFHKALYLEPGYYEALISLKLIYEQKGDKERASVLRERASRILNAEKIEGVDR